jgi:hypothetical protein
VVRGETTGKRVLRRSTQAHAWKSVGKKKGATRACPSGRVPKPGSTLNLLCSRTEFFEGRRFSDYRPSLFLEEYGDKTVLLKFWERYSEVA